MRPKFKLDQALFITIDLKRHNKDRFHIYLNIILLEDISSSK